MVKWAPENEQSEFNQAIATLMRIHSALLELGHATSTNNPRKKYYFLKVLKFEVKPVMNDKERTENEKYEKDIEIANNEINKAYSNKTFKVNRDTIKKLDIYEEFLRDVIQRHNLGLPQKKDPRYALANK